jgi:hypothetical protein
MLDNPGAAIQARPIKLARKAKEQRIVGSNGREAPEDQSDSQQRNQRVCSQMGTIQSQSNSALTGPPTAHSICLARISVLQIPFMG